MKYWYISEKDILILEKIKGLWLIESKFCLSTKENNLL